MGTHFGATYLEAAQKSPNWEIAGIVAKTQVSRDEAGDKFSVDENHRYEDLETALQQCENVEAVTIAVPNDMHYPLAKMVLDSGKHLILEKPITETWEQAIDLVRILDTHPDAKAMIGQTLRGEINLRMMAYHLQQGIIGKIEQITFESHYNWINDPKIDRNWRFRLPDMFLDDIGIHQIDTIRMLSGNKKCKELVAATWTPESYPIRQITGTTATGTWLLEDDIRVSYFGSMSCKGHDIGWYGRVHVFGENGCVFRDSEGQPYVFRGSEVKGIGLDDAYGENVDEYLPFVDYQKIPYLLEDFAEAIENDRAPITDLHDNINSHAILLGMKQSAQDRSWIDVQAAYPQS
ncbi:MAG TPA: Gfo/Idh/MocA family oxidoreductase [Candidatus Lokiarchaeia archaeon]|nr:Gfo/Idh/MocA family oxidoreductase [Candidatus Lokiarchaeia archaeon]